MFPFYQFPSHCFTSPELEHFPWYYSPQGVQVLFQRFGHHKDRCRCEPRCAQCGEHNHEADSCNNPLKCPNCQGNHLASSKECPKWILEKEVQTVKYTRHISYPEARKLVESRMPSGKTYAAAAKADVQLPSTSLSSASVLNRSVTTSSTQTRLTGPNSFPSYPTFWGEPPDFNRDKVGTSTNQPGPNKDNTTGSSREPSGSLSQPGPSRDHTGSSQNQLGSSQNQSQAGSVREQSGPKNQSGSRSQSGSKKSQKHSTGSQPISNETKSTSKDNKSPQNKLISTASTDPSTGRGKTNSTSIVKKSKTDRSKQPTASNSKQLNKLTSNRFDPLSMDTSEPISPACIPPRPVAQRNPILPP